MYPVIEDTCFSSDPTSANLTVVFSTVISPPSPGKSISYVRITTSFDTKRTAETIMTKARIIPAIVIIFFVFVDMIYPFSAVGSIFGSTRYSPSARKKRLKRQKFSPYLNNISSPKSSVSQKNAVVNPTTAFMQPSRHFPVAYKKGSPAHDLQRLPFFTIPP